MRFAVALLPLPGLVLAQCDDEPARPRRPPPALSAQRPPPEASARASTDLLDAGAPLDPAPAGGDLAADIAAFTTLDACVASHGVTDAVLGDALGALGYDGFVRDACRVLQAAKEKRPEPCRDITVSTLANHCKTLVAIVAREPESCPTSTAGARDATCLALARQDARLCAGEYEPRRSRCEAILTRNAKRCASAREGRNVCERDVARYASFFAQSKAKGPITQPSATFAIMLADGGAPRVAPGDDSLLGSFGQGAVVLEEKGTGVRRIDFGTGYESVSLRSYLAPTLRMSVELPAVPDGGAPANKKIEGGRVRSARLEMPRGPQLLVPPAKSDFVVRWNKLELEPGGALEFEIEGTAGEGDDLLKARVDVKTFVRDVVVGAPASPIKQK